jgi:hypothetical protein
MVGRRLTAATLHKALTIFVEPSRASDPARAAAHAAQLQQEAESKKFADAWFVAASQWSKLKMPLAAGPGTVVAGVHAEPSTQTAEQ